MKIPNSHPSASVVETPKSYCSPSADPFAGESTSDYAPDSLSPSMESVLSDQGTDYDPDTLRFSPPLPPDLKVDSFVDETPLCEQGLWFDLSSDSFTVVKFEALSRNSELPRGEGIGAGKSGKYQSGSGVRPGLATWECNEDRPWMTSYYMQQDSKRRRKMEGEDKQVAGSKAVISTPSYLLIYV